MKTTHASAAIAAVWLCLAAPSLQAQHGDAHHAQHSRNAGATSSTKAEAVMTQTAGIEIPAGLVVDHEELHEALVAVIDLGGATGEAAREVAHRLHPHFVREEEFALPPLGLLASIARGNVTPDMAAVLPLIDTLRAEHAHMLAEHAHILAALDALRAAGKTEGHPEAERFADKLTVHAQVEEQVLYPASLLVGDRVRAALAGTRTE